LHRQKKPARRPEVASPEKPGRRRYQEVLPLEQCESKKKISKMRQRREALARGPKIIIKTSKTSIIHHHRLKQKSRWEKSEKTMMLVYTS